MIERELNDGVLTLRLAHGKANAMDIELCDALRLEVESAAEAANVSAVILTGSGSIFSAGVDLPRMVGEGGDYVQRFVESLDAVFRALFLLPQPVVAAINGHAIAGGAILAYGCDHRIMAGGRIGTPELLVGVPFPPLALEIVRFAVPPQQLQSLVYHGRTVEPEEAKAIGIIDEVVSADQLMPRATEVARFFAGLAPEAFRITKRQLREPCLRDSAQMAIAATEEIDALWGAPATHERIRQYLAKTIGKK